MESRLNDLELEWDFVFYFNDVGRSIDELPAFDFVFKFGKALIYFYRFFFG